MKEKEIKIATIKGENAEKIQKTLETTGILIFRPGKKDGRQVLNVYTQDI